jgi:hypothetical protein
MAKINEQIINIKLSQLLRDQDEENQIVNDKDLVVLLEALGQIAGNDVLIELEGQ